MRKPYALFSGSKLLILLVCFLKVKIIVLHGRTSDKAPPPPPPAEVKVIMDLLVDMASVSL